jgi:hypothetical protein
VSVGSIAAERRGDLADARIFQARRTGVATELRRLEAQPRVGLIAHGFVVVVGVVDDHERASRGAKRG